MIDLKHFESCVCLANGEPDALCSSKLSFQENGKKVCLSVRTGEEAKAVVIDQCVCADNDTKCDGLFLYRRNNKHWMILVELKEGDFKHAFEQLAYTRHRRPQYKEIEELFIKNQTGQLKHEAFIVSNHQMPKNEIQKLENEHQMRVKAILFSEATSPTPDIRKYL